MIQVNRCGCAFSEPSSVEELVKSVGITATDDDLSIIKYICAILSIRCAQLVSVSIISAVEYIEKNDTLFEKHHFDLTADGRKRIGVAIDGSLYNNHHKLRLLMSDFLNQLAPNYSIEHFGVPDGSGKGAGLLALALGYDR